ncbi:MAG: PEP/pyruvate-binding domain-containing protein [Deltaproteobacteria bacterium]|nr:PEP/pyruvate-binding domain-containing protein [Deltaproteobacteria bacterium]
MRGYIWVSLLVVAACSSKPKDQEPPPSPAPASGSSPSSPSGPADAAAAPADASVATGAEIAAGSGSAVAPSIEPAVSRVWTGKLADAAAFESYSKELGGERFAKFVVDLKTDAIYYFDVNVYTIHKDFIFKELYKKERTKEANRIFDRNYTLAKTDFLMVYLVHHLHQDQWTFAFWDGDLVSPDHVRKAYKRMKETFYLGEKVRFRPDSPYQEKVALDTRDVPHIRNDQLYMLAEYTAFNKGVSVGTLRLIAPETAEADLVFGTDEIVLVHRPLADITPVAGIISETFSTPLSHLSLRAKGWKIPNIGLRDASKKLAALAGKKVFFEAKDASYVIREATEADVVAHQHRLAARAVVVPPKADLAATDLIAIDKMVAADVHRVGAKAANLGVIAAAKLAGVKVPPGFGIPYAYYDKHLKAAGLDKAIAAMLADDTFKKDAAVRKARLAALRKQIAAAPLDAETCAKIGTALETLGGPGTGVFVRSSHNAEDLPDFSGAGVYDTVPNVRGKAAVCDAVKDVWSSIWNPAAYEARRVAGIDEALVYGGVLVQVGVNAAAAGVMVTVHPTDPDDERQYTINAKSGLGMAVVDGRKVPESMIVSWYNGGIRVLSRSDEDTVLQFDEQGGVREVPNTNKGKPVLSNAMALRLAGVGHRLTQVFANKKLDVEWVVADDQLYIVQTRPLVNQ